MTPKIQSVRDAKLPATYVNAQRALADCSRLDECKTWADKAAAMASYAKQSQDETLMKTAIRIQARAIRRCGELLKQIEGGSTAHRRRVAPDPSTSTRKGSAYSAGLSDRERKTAIRIANVPKADFERAVESNSPPSLTELSEAGKREAANREYLTSPKPPGFKHATALLGTLRDFTEFCNKADAALVAEALSKREAKRALRDMETITTWLKSLKRRMG